jgi:protein-disulfide isomerase
LASLRRAFGAAIPRISRRKLVSAPPRSSSQRSPLLPLYLLLALVAVVGGFFIFRQMQKKNTSANANLPEEVKLTPQQLNATPGISIGNANAPITLLEFADFQCPHCAQFATMVEPVLKEQMVATGKVRLVFHDFPLGGGFQWSFLAARSGRCANEQGKFWEYHDYVFGKQQDWSYETDQEKVIDHFTEYATAVGADADKFEACVRSDKYRAEVSRSRAFGEQLQVQGTPTLFVNGKRVPGVPEDYKDLRPVLERELPQSAAAAPAAGAAAAPAGAAPAATPAAPAKP